MDELKNYSADLKADQHETEQIGTSLQQNCGLAWGKLSRNVGLYKRTMTLELEESKLSSH